MPETLTIIIYILLIILIIVARAIGIKLIVTLQKVDELLDDVKAKIKTFDRVFELVDTVNDKVSIVGDTVIGIISGAVKRLIKVKRNKNKYKFEEEDEDE